MISSATRHRRNHVQQTDLHLEVLQLASPAALESKGLIPMLRTADGGYPAHPHARLDKRASKIQLTALSYATI